MIWSMLSSKRRRRRRRGVGPQRRAQERAIRETVRKESWLEMLIRKRREAKGKPKRRSPVNKLHPDDD